MKADDIQAKLKACKDQAIRALRDKQDIYTDGGNTVKVGKHAFSVNKQMLDLTLLPRDQQLMLHLTGTEYFDVIPDSKSNQLLNDASAYWQQNLISENRHFYRGEYLAAQVLAAAEQEENDFTQATLELAADSGGLLAIVQKFAEPRYQEGYEKGIHDHDASLILENLLQQKQQLGLLTYPASCRVAAQLFYTQLSQTELTELTFQATQAELMATKLDDHSFSQQLSNTLSKHITVFCQQNLSGYVEELSRFSGELSAAYLIKALARQHKPRQFDLAATAKQVSEQFISMAKAKGVWQQLEDSLAHLTKLADKCRLLSSWLRAYGSKQNESAETLLEAANCILLSTQLDITYQVKEAEVNSEISGLMGQHPRIDNQVLYLDYADFFARSNEYLSIHVPAYKQYQQLKAQVLEAQKQRLQLDEFKPRPLSSFVRNQLIDKVYFPIIGDNLAKQIGAAGNNKRTDLMGMLLLISPPGYGKTTLIEYVANRLGLTFVKVNCPSIGHDQVSLDPAQAINATAAKEIEKINQSFEMGNNVMLYLDDIQHTNPEFLQKFISLCDGSRRIDGVWNGRSKTYDLRGKKFAVVMAGNPYTESGESFKIPDMLANRADIYNLGDTLSGCEQEFAMSFIENTLTSNAVLAPLANRGMEDLYKLVRIAQGEDLSINELEFNYSQAQVNEIVSVLKKLLTIRDTILKVNAQYIASAAQDDNYRTEPPFKLQGSYRNMNKMAEKVVAAMNDSELENLIQDHYRGEAQTLSKGSEENLLKLAQLRGTLTDEAAARWCEIKAEYARLNRSGDEGSPAQLAVEQLSFVNKSLAQIAAKLDKEQLSFDYSALLQQLAQVLDEQEFSTQLTELRETLSQQPYVAPLTQLIASQQQVVQEMTGLQNTIQQTANGQQLLANLDKLNDLLNTQAQIQHALGQQSQQQNTLFSHLSDRLEAVAQPQIQVDNHLDDSSAKALEAVTTLLANTLTNSNTEPVQQQLKDILHKLEEIKSRPVVSNDSGAKNPYML